MEKQIYSDGVGQVTVIGGVVRLDFVAYSPTEKDAKGQFLPAFCQRVVMSPDSFLQATAKIQEAAQAIAKLAPRPRGKPRRRTGRSGRSGQARPWPPAAEPAKPAQASLSLNHHRDFRARRTRALKTPAHAGEQQQSCEQTDRHQGACMAVARHLGLDWSLPRLVHVYGKEQEPDAGGLVRIAQAEGLKARTLPEPTGPGWSVSSSWRPCWCG